MDHKLTKFIAVVEAGSLTLAAETLHVSQPALTIALRELEREYGQELLKRSSRGMTLTRAGEFAYASAVRMREEERQLRARLMTRDYQTPQFRLGLLDSIAVGVVSAARAEWKHMELRVDNTDRLLRDIRAGRLEMAVVTGSKPEVSGCSVTQAGRERFVLVKSRNYTIHPEESIPWVAYNQDSHTYAHFTKQFAKQGITPLPVCYSTSIELMLVLCRLGLGVALVPESFVRGKRISKELETVALGSFDRPLWIIERNDSTQTHVQAEALRAILLEQYNPIDKAARI